MATKIEIGDLLLDLNRERVLLFPRGGFGKFLPKHLTVYFRPVQKSGALVYTPHVTDPGKRAWYLKRMVPSEVVRVMNAIGDDLVRVWVAKTTYVGLQTATDDGWLVSALTERQFNSIVAAFKTGEKRYQFNERTVERISLEMIDALVSPLDLDASPTKPRAPISVMRVHNDELETALLSFYPNGLNGPPGWYITPMDWLGPGHEVFEQIMLRHVPAGFWKGTRTALRLLGLPFDEARVEAWLSRAEPVG